MVGQTISHYKITHKLGEGGRRGLTAKIARIRNMVPGSRFPWCEDNDMSELVFEVTQEADGGYCAECLAAEIFTQGDNWEELRENVREAVRAFFFDGAAPERICQHLVRDEMLAVQ